MSNRKIDIIKESEKQIIFRIKKKPIKISHVTAYLY